MGQFKLQYMSYQEVPIGDNVVFINCTTLAIAATGALVSYNTKRMKCGCGGVWG